MTKTMDFGELKVGVIEDNHWMGVLGNINNCKLEVIRILFVLKIGDGGCKL
jgi:hypothetical protein